MTQATASPEVVNNSRKMTWTSSEFYTPFNTLIHSVVVISESGLQRETIVIRVDGIGEITFEKLRQDLLDLSTAKDFLKDPIISSLFRGILDKDEQLADEEFFRLNPCCFRLFQL